jgi:WD40 repeat protein
MYMDRLQRAELEQLPIEDLRTLYQEFLGNVPDDNLTSEQLLNALESRPILDAYLLEQILLQVPDKRELNVLCRTRNFREICRRPSFRRDWQMLHTGFPLQGHTDWVNSVAWSSDGTKLASSSSDGSIRIWNVGTAETITTLQGHIYVVWSVAWSPDGTKLASGSVDRSIRIWNAETAESIATLQGHIDTVTSIAWSPDDTKLASGSGDESIRIWNAETAESIATLQGHADAVTSVAWSPDGTKLASGSYDESIRIWDVEQRSILLPPPWGLIYK